MEKEYVVALVFSGWQLSKIFNFFTDYLDSKPGDIGCSKIERYRDKRTGEMRDSNRTLILLKRELFDKAIEEGLDMPQPNLDFRIARYLLKESSYPTTGYSSNLFILIPKNISVQEAELTISERMKCFTSFNVLQMEDFTIKTPLQSRLTGEHRGFIYLSFSGNVDLTTRTLIKALLNDSFIFLQSMEKLYHLPVFWARRKTEPEVIKVTKILKRDADLIL